MIVRAANSGAHTAQVSSRAQKLAHARNDLLMNTRTSLRLLALVALLLVAPFFFPRRPRVARRAIIRGKPTDVFPLINDLRNWPRWTMWNRREEIHYTYDGPPGGVGSVQQWSSRKMEGTLRITQSVPDERIAYTLDIAQGQYRLEGVIALEPIGSGHTRVTWLARLDNSSVNPYARYLDLIGIWWIGRDFSASLENLRELAETKLAMPAQQAVV